MILHHDTAPPLRSLSWCEVNSVTRCIHPHEYRNVANVLWKLLGLFDMLGGGGGAGTFYSWNRAHFGAWCIVSSPLILGTVPLAHDVMTLNPSGVFVSWG